MTYNRAVSLPTLQRIKSFAAEEPTILLPAHDPDVAARLEGKTVMRLSSVTESVPAMRKWKTRFQIALDLALPRL